jgi:putative heme-binding domain-containing protein
MRREHVPASAEALVNWLDHESDHLRVTFLLESLSSHPGADIRQSLEAIMGNPLPTLNGQPAAVAAFVQGPNRERPDVSIAPVGTLNVGPLSRSAEHQRLVEAVLARSGDPQRGRTVFADAEKSLCLKCHWLNNQGERIGPDLTGLGSRFSRIHIAESILEPSRTIAPSFGTLTLQLDSGHVISGIKIAESDTTLTLADIQGLKRIVPQDSIEERHASASSTMPEGLEKLLTEDEFVDLVAFLASLTETPTP